MGSVDRKTFRLCAITSLGTFFGAIALPHAWAWVAAGLFLSTSTWIMIVIASACLGVIGSSALFITIPNKIRQTLDNFALQMGIRIETIEGRLGDRLGELRLLLEQHIASKDQEAIASQESLMAEFVTVFLGMAITESHLAAGQCKVCGGKHPKASELQPGDPALYSYEAHEKLKDGKPCPIPYLYKLAQDRSKIQSRTTKLS